jgi:hypothetical protein
MPAGLQASKEEIETFFAHQAFEFFRNECLVKVKQGGSSLSNPATTELRFHREPKIDKSQAFRMHILVDFMMGIDKAGQHSDGQQVLDLSLVKEQNGQLKLLLFSNIDSPLLSNLCGIISDQYGIPIEYPQLDPKNYNNNKKNKSISVDVKMRLDGDASVKQLDRDAKARLTSRYREDGRSDLPEEGALHAEQRAQQYIKANPNLNLVHHANTQTSFCDENVKMRRADTIPVLKPLQEDFVLSNELSNRLDKLIEARLSPGGNKADSDAISGIGVVSEIVSSFFDNFSDLNVDALNLTMGDGGPSFQPFNVTNVEKIIGLYRREVQKPNGREVQKPNVEIRPEHPKETIMNLLKKWWLRLRDVSPEQIINDQWSKQNELDKRKGTCQCCRQALRDMVGVSGSFIQDIPGEIPAQFAAEGVPFSNVVSNMVSHGFLEIRSSEDKPEDKPKNKLKNKTATYVFTKTYTDMALNAESRELFIDSLAKVLNVDNRVLTNFFELDFFAHLRGTLVPWPLPKGRQGRTLPLDHDKIINTAMLGENRDRLDLKALLDKKSPLHQTEALPILDTRDAEIEGKAVSKALTILDTRDAEREDVSKTLADRLGVSLLKKGESDGTNAVQLEYVLHYGGVAPSTYKVILQHKHDVNLGISEIKRVGAQGHLEIVFPALSPSDREGQ